MDLTLINHIDYIELNVSYGKALYKGLLLNFDRTDRILCLHIKKSYQVAINLDAAKINSITVKSTDKSATTLYDTASQHRAIETIEDYMTAFLNRNACDIFGGVNLNIYRNTPECYGIEEKIMCNFPKTTTEQTNALSTVITLPATYQPVVTKPKQTFLETRVLYYEPTGDGYTQKKLVLLERNSGLPSGKKLANMLMKVAAATKNVFISKVVPLSEETTTKLEKGKEEEEEADPRDFYGEGYFGY